MPRDFSTDELAAAPAPTSIDSLLLDMTDEESDAFAAAQYEACASLAVVASAFGVHDRSWRGTAGQE